MLTFKISTIRFCMQLTGVAVLAIITPLCVVSQQGTLKVINKPAVYKKLVRGDSLQKMAPLSLYINNLTLDLRYSTNENFSGTKLYPEIPTTYARLPVVKALAAIQQELNKVGLGLKVWDAYRPYSVTQAMWKLIKDERYVANPAKGSGHNRGIAVDVTLIDVQKGTELDMGTGFDNFSDTAHHAFKGLNADQQRNRNLLKSTMEAHGFNALSTEWWHYSWPEANRYPVLNLSFRQLARLTD